MMSLQSRADCSHNHVSGRKVVTVQPVAVWEHCAVWERCFDAPMMEASEFFTQGLYQATFEELRLR